jgi:hypothetical protein
MIQLRQEWPDYTTPIYLKALTYQCHSKEQTVERTYIRRAQNLNARRYINIYTHTYTQYSDLVSPTDGVEPSFNQATPTFH